jgi:hypothetical protein
MKTNTKIKKLNNVILTDGGLENLKDFINHNISFNKTHRWVLPLYFLNNYTKEFDTKESKVFGEIFHKNIDQFILLFENALEKLIKEEAYEEAAIIHETIKTSIEIKNKMI